VLSLGKSQAGKNGDDVNPAARSLLRAGSRVKSAIGAPGQPPRTAAPDSRPGQPPRTAAPDSRQPVIDACSRHWNPAMGHESSGKAAVR
jgi:hypothetical protein